MSKNKVTITAGLFIYLVIFIPGFLFAEPYNYYNQYKGSEEERRRGTEYYYTQEEQRSRDGRQEAGKQYYYPEQYDKSQDNEVRAGTDYYYEVNDGEFKKDGQPLQIRKYYQDLNKDGIYDVFTMCLEDSCYDYDQSGQLLGVRKVSGDSSEEDKKVELKQSSPQ